MQRFRAFILFVVATLFIGAAPAEAQNKGGDETASKTDSAASFRMEQSWSFVAESKYFTDKGPLDCPRCGKFVIKRGAGNKINSIKFNRKSGETIVEAYYQYVTFDGSGFSPSKSRWSGLTRLPAQTTLPDPEGVNHDVILVYAGVSMRHRTSPMPQKGGLVPDNL